MSRYYSFAQGNTTIAGELYSHAEGSLAKAVGVAAHAEGGSTYAFGNVSHAEGAFTSASGEASHAEGAYTLAAGEGSHAEGDSTVALGNYSHASGYSTISSGSYQNVTGKFNTHNDTTSRFIVGNGTSDVARKDAFKVTHSSSIVVATQSAAPAWIGVEGEMVPAVVGGTSYLYVYINGGWKKTTLTA